jgi:chromosome segregation ATPase
MRLALLFTWVLYAGAFSGSQTISPVQKVIELLEENKLKILNDLGAEEKAMGEYAEYCDKEASEKGYAIQTSDRKIGDLGATIEDCNTKIPAYEDEVSTLGSEVAAKTKQLYEASEVRKSQKADFDVVEKELMTSIDQLDRAVTIIKRETGAGASFIQGGSKSEQNVNTAVKALGKIIDSTRISFSARKSLKSLLQFGNLGKEDEYESLRQPQAKEVAYESKSGGIISKIEEMKEKAEETLTDARNTELKAQQDYNMLEQSLNSGIAVAQDKISAAKSAIGAKGEEMNGAKGEMQETLASKAADEKFLAQLKHDCEEAAANWAQRQESAKAETGAINKAIEVLSEGVRVLLQKKSSIVSKKQVNDALAKEDQDFGDDDASPSADGQSNAQSESRAKLVTKLKDLSRKFGSYALMEMAGSAAMDPFAKIKGLIEEMISKLVQEAQEEATQKAFCDEEMGKSSKAKAEKTLTLDKLQSRLDKAAARKAELEQSIKDLEGEIAELDAGTAEATKIRNEENTLYLKSSKDFADAAAATEKAIKVLKEFYDSAALIQTGAKSSSNQPEFGSAKGGAGGVIISILEMSNEDFTKLHSECEASEAEALESYEKLMNENTAAKAASQAEAKAAASEVKSLTVALENTGEDHSMTSKELAAVLEYVEKLKPQCEQKAMSYAEKKARREAEISGLKEALEILAGETVFVQKNLRLAKRHA